MAFQCTKEDVEWWTTSDAQKVVDIAQGLLWGASETVASTGTLRKNFPDLSVTQINSVIELVLGRQLALKKLGPETNTWFLTQETVQQATARTVVDHRATRLAAAYETGAISGVHDATCSIGTEVAALDRLEVAVDGSDIDDARLAMAVHNVPDHSFVQHDALSPTWADTVVTILDPARRTRTGRRMYHGPDSTTPRLTDVLDVYRNRPYVIKAAPGIDWKELFANGWGTGPWGGEVEIVSITGRKRGGVKEAALWSSQFSDEGVHRRATVLTPGGDVVDVVTDHPDNIARAQAQKVQQPGSVIVEPDGAIVRAGLVREWGAMHGLWLMDEHIAHLSGDKAPVDVPYYHIEQRLRFRKTDLKKALQQLPTSSLEILVRGVNVEPTILRKQIFRNPVKEAPARTLIVTRIGDHAAAFICSERRVG